MLFLLLLRGKEPAQYPTSFTIRAASYLLHCRQLKRLLLDHALNFRQERAVEQAHLLENSGITFA